MVETSNQQVLVRRVAGFCSAPLPGKSLRHPVLQRQPALQRPRSAPQLAKTEDCLGPGGRDLNLAGAGHCGSPPPVCPLPRPCSAVSRSEFLEPLLAEIPSWYDSQIPRVAAQAAGGFPAVWVPTSSPAVRKANELYPLQRRNAGTRPRTWLPVGRANRPLSAGGNSTAKRPLRRIAPKPSCAKELYRYHADVNNDKGNGIAKMQSSKQDDGRGNDSATNAGSQDCAGNSCEKKNNGEQTLEKKYQGMTEILGSSTYVNTESLLAVTGATSNAPESDEDWQKEMRNVLEHRLRRQHLREKIAQEEDSAAVDMLDTSALNAVADDCLLYSTDQVDLQAHLQRRLRQDSLLRGGEP